MNRVVLDANIYVKLFKKDEHDSEDAIHLIKKLVENDIQLIEPAVVINETIRTCEIAHQNIQEVVDFFKALIEFKMSFVELVPSLLDDTMNITREGNAKSGYLTFSDSLYQAIAIQENALFITADRRHYEKTKHTGNIQLLKDLH